MTGAEFVRWREKMGLTLTEAANALGLSYPAVQSYERGRRVPPEPIAKLCDMLLQKKEAGRV